MHGMRACCFLISILVAACAPEPITGDEPLPGEVTGMITMHCGGRVEGVTLAEVESDPLLCGLRTGVYVCGDYHIVFGTGTDFNFHFYVKDGVLVASSAWVSGHMSCAGPETFTVPVCSGGNVLPLPSSCLK